MSDQPDQFSCNRKPYCPLTIAREWWPMLLPVLVMVGVYGAKSAGWTAALDKPLHEIIALCLLSSALTVAIKGWLAGRERFGLVLTALCLVFLLREIHFPGAKIVLYGGVALIGVWAVLWAKSLLPSLLGRPRGRWLVVVIWTYALALLVQRRALKFLPDEENIHIELEEVIENLGHLFLLILGLL